MNILDDKLNNKLKEIKNEIEHEKGDIVSEYIDYIHENYSSKLVKDKTREETYNYYKSIIEKYKSKLKEEKDSNNTGKILRALTYTNDYVIEFEEKKKEKDAKLEELTNVKKYNLMALAVKQSIKEDYEELIDKKSDLQKKIEENQKLFFSSNDNINEINKKDNKLKKEYFLLIQELKDLKDLYNFNGCLISKDDEDRFLYGSESVKEYFNIITGNTPEKIGLNLSKIKLDDELDIELEDKNIVNNSNSEEKNNNTSETDDTKNEEEKGNIKNGADDSTNNLDDENIEDDLLDDETEHMEPDILVPENLKQKPILTWKTVAAVAAGALTVGGCYAAFGVGAMGVTLAASVIARRFVKNKEKKIKTKEEEIEKLIEEANDLIRKNKEIKDSIQKLLKETPNEKIENILNLIMNIIPEDNKEYYYDLIKRLKNPLEFISLLPHDIFEQIKKEYPTEFDFIDNVYNLYNEYYENQNKICGLKETSSKYYNDIYPDLKNDDRFKTPEKINNLTDAKEYLKAKGRKVKAYLGSKEGLRDCRWLCNSVMITSIGITLGHGINSLLNKPEGIEVTNPVDQIQTDPINPAPEPEIGNDILFSDIKEGAGIGDYNVSIGHDTAGWAVNGENAETLISKYVNAENTVFKRFGMFDGEKYIPIDLGGKSLGEYIATTGIDPSKIAVGVADKSNLVDQAWLSLEELTKGIGRSI